MFRKNYQCPKCCGSNLIICDDIIECGDCCLTFERIDFENCDIDNILSIEEKDEILNCFDEDELKNIFNNLKNENNKCD